MRRPARLLLAGMLVLPLAAAGCGAVGPTTGTVAAGPTVTASADSHGLTPVRFDHWEARPVTAVPTVRVRRGTTVVLTVGSDVARRVLVPEQGRAVDVSAGGTVPLRFLALGTFTVRVAEPGAVRGGTIIGRVEPWH